MRGQSVSAVNQDETSLALTHDDKGKTFSAFIEVDEVLYTITAYCLLV